MLVFEERGKPETQRKTSQSREENQQQTQATYDAGPGNQTRNLLVGSECSHHCNIPAPRAIPAPFHNNESSIFSYSADIYYIP